MGVNAFQIGELFVNQFTLILKKGSDYEIEALTFQLTHFAGQCHLLAHGT